MDPRASDGSFEPRSVLAKNVRRPWPTRVAHAHVYVDRGGDRAAPSRGAPAERARDHDDPDAPRARRAAVRAARRAARHEAMTGGGAAPSSGMRRTAGCAANRAGPSRCRGPRRRPRALHGLAGKAPQGGSSARAAPPLSRPLLRANRDRDLDNTGHFASCPRGRRPRSRPRDRAASRPCDGASPTPRGSAAALRPGRRGARGVRGSCGETR